MIPDTNAWVNALVDVVQSFNWQDFALLYSDRQEAGTTLVTTYDKNAIDIGGN
jgi:hypothetical protein